MPVARTPPSKRGGWTKQPEEVRRGAILDAARGCFCKKGYANTSVQDIAGTAGLTKGGVYFHFASKEEILASLVRDFTDVARFGLDAPEVLELPPVARLREQVARLLAGLQVQGHATIGSLTEAITRYGVGIPQLKQFFSDVVTIISNTLVAGQQAGMFRQADPRLLAEVVIAAVDGLALHEELDNAGIHMCSGHDRVLDLVVRCVTASASREQSPGS